MDWITLIGLVAAACTTGSMLPQAIEVVQTKHTKDLSLGTYILATFGVSLWLVYGFLIGNMPILIANILTIFMVSTILAYKLKYK